MKISVTIPDETMETYVKTFGLPGCYAHMRNAIDAFKNFDKNDRYLIVHGDVRREIEAVFQTTVDTQEKLSKLIKNQNSVKIEGVELNFTSDELARIAMQATFHGRTTEQFILEMVKELKDMMLDKV